MKLRKLSAIVLVLICSGMPILLMGQSITDLDKNTYTAVKIGSQTWMGQNLNVSQFRNGDPIPEVTTDDAWEKAGLEKKPAWCFYEFNAENGNSYGKLYKWYAVNDPRGLAPKGWHIPSDADWTKLVETLGGEEKAGGKTKEKGMTHWNTPNTGATNESGFTALPSGLNYSFSSFVYLGHNAYWWTSTENGDETAILFSVTYENGSLTNLFLNKGVGLAVRCIKD